MLVTSLRLEAIGLEGGQTHAQLVLEVGPSVTAREVPLNGPWVPGAPIDVRSADLAAALLDLAAALPAIVQTM
jgi:hypothetical protein